LSDLVRERAAFADARRRATEIRDRSLEVSARRGLSVGFLAVGMATWDHRGAGLVPQAPVLLRSCHLRPTDAASSDFDVDLGVEVELNPVLEEYLRAAQGIDLEARALAEMALLTNGFDPYPVYAALARLCAAVPGFTVTPRLVVSTFPYSKLHMVSDLAGQEERLGSHEVVAALAERAVESDRGLDRGSDIEPDSAQVRGDVDPDPDPGSERMVLDSDAAQSEALDLVLRRRDLVVEAPPGTGASQTVANIVATCAGSRRSVLLVAQERSEIEAVQRALSSVGLGGLVLGLDDMSFDHRGTAERLAGLLEPGDIEAEHGDHDDHDGDAGDDGDDDNSDHDRDEQKGRGVDASAPVTVRLRRHRDVLRDRLEALHRTRPPWGVTVHEAQSAITVLGSRSPAPSSRVRIRGAALERLSRERLDQLSSQLSDAVAVGAWSDTEGGDPWYGARIGTEAEAERAGEIVSRLGSGGFDAAAETLDRILSESSLPPATTVSGWDSTLATMTGVRDTLEVFRPEIFDVPLDEHVAATGSREYRKNHPSDLGAANRIRVRRLAARLLRPGRPPEDLHAELLRARGQRKAWHDLVGAGGRPEISPRLDEAQSTYDALDADLTWLGERLAPTAAGGDLHGIPVRELRARLRSLADRPERLAVLPQVVPVLDELRAAGMGEVLDDFAARGVDADEVGPELEHIWWVSIERQVADSDPRYGQHDGAALRRSLADFVRADREHLRANAFRVRQEVGSWRGEALDAHRAQAALVRAEAARRDRPAQVRSIVDSAGELLVACAPCWAMSPLVVAEVLPPGERFDVVVVLGAERVSTAVVVSTLSRGRQVVVVGDPEGTGPTSFATGPVTWSDEAATTPLPASSFLADASSVLPVRRLTWAHGLADERLLALTNRAAPAGALSGVPSPDPASPVTLDTVDGRADLEPGEDTTIDSTDAEVERVVALVLDHARAHPEQTLAVVTVTRRHAERLAVALRTQREHGDEDLRGFLDPARPEPVLVIAMADLAGRSRDRVILSVGYGRTRHGRVLYRFPELSTAGARASLTAALAAARAHVTVVSSFTADDLDPERLSDAATVLREALRFAARDDEGDAGAETGDNELSSGDPLLADLADRLRREGLVVAEGLGIGPRTIDLAVADPHDECRWLVAVEGDRPGYAAGLGTRERDRLWAQELRRRGWRHVRVWSTDLYRDPAREVARVVAATRTLGSPAAAGLPDESTTAGTPAGGVESDVDERPTTTSRRVIRPGSAEPVAHTSDDTDSGWGERVDENDHERWLNDQRPPHWE
ncbi:MAG: DNA helicase, partial [Actinomycetota bacterium]|nr:DNA helicase [Actinomycetota bacterium]